MKEIGGYIELDEIKGKHYHENAVILNCGRSCLMYLIKAKLIKKLYIPYYLCDTVRQCCKANKVEIEFYSINSEFMPCLNNFDNDAYVYVVNYFNFLDSESINWLHQRIPNLIIDNSQAFFSPPIPDIDTLYVARKFLGVADGAYLYTNKLLEEDIEIDCVCDRMSFILGRYEKSASEYYEDYVKNNNYFDEMKLKRCSKISMNILKGLDYDIIKKQRTANYMYLANKINRINKLNVPDNVEGAFAYPLLMDNGFEIKRQLIKEKIYVPTLWPDVLDNCDITTLEYDLARNLIPLPVDQRYSENDMEYMLSCIERLV